MQTVYEAMGGRDKATMIHSVRMVMDLTSAHKSLGMDHAALESKLADFQPLAVF